MKTNQKKFLMLLVFLLTAFISPVKSSGDYVTSRTLNETTPTGNCLDEKLTNNEERMAPCDKKWGLYKPYVTSSSIKIGWNNGNDTKGRYTIKWSGASKGFKNVYAKRSHTIKDLKPGKKHYISVTKTCSAGGKITRNIQVWTKIGKIGKASGNCDGIWQGRTLTYQLFDDASIKVKWTHNSSILGSSGKPKYTVFWQEWNSNSVKTASAGSKDNFHIKGLKHSTSYAVWVERNCNNTKEGSQVVYPQTCGTQGCGSIVTDRCDPVTGLKVSDVKPRSAMLSYDNFNGEGNTGNLSASFFIQQTTGGWSGWHSKSGIVKPTKNSWNAVTNDNHPLPNRTYKWKVTKVCSFTILGDLVRRTVVTEGENFTTPPWPKCPKPVNLRLASISPTHGHARWDKVVEAESYGIALRASTGNWIRLKDNKKPEVEGSLQPGVLYHLVAKSICPNATEQESGWSKVLSFYAANPAGKNKSAESQVSNTQKSMVYPNTNQGNFKIKFGDEGNLIKSVTIHDMYGNQVLHKEYNAELKEAEYNLSNELKSGIYKIKIHTKNGVEYKTLLVEH